MKLYYSFLFWTERMSEWTCFDNTGIRFMLYHRMPYMIILSIFVEQALNIDLLSDLILRYLFGFWLFNHCCALNREYLG